MAGYYFGFAILPAALGGNAPTVRQGLLPEWVGAREILFRRGNPYRPEVTKDIQETVYGHQSSSRGNQQRFAYPVYFAFLFSPLALVSFETAKMVALVGCLIATALSVKLWMRCVGLPQFSVIAIAVAVFAWYPVVLGLQLCQPSLLIAGMLATAVFCTRSGRLVWAGAIAGVCTAKPQLAIAVLLPLCIWSVARWSERKRFFFSLFVTTLSLVTVSELVVPGWIGPWLTTLRAYAGYAGSAPILRDTVGSGLFAVACVLLISAVVWVGCRFGEHDVMFAISFSVAVFQLLFPFLIYNEVLLLPAVLWLLQHSNEIRARSQWHKLLWNLTWIVLLLGAAASAALSLLSVVSAGAALKLWQLPLLAAWIYPVTAFLALSAWAVPRTLRRAASSSSV